MDNQRLGAHYDLVNRDFLATGDECEIGELPLLTRSVKSMSDVICIPLRRYPYSEICSLGSQGSLCLAMFNYR